MLRNEPDAASCFRHEANLLTGEPLVLQSKKGEQLFTVASKPEMLSTGYTSAWRVILYGTTPGVLVDSHLIELLNPDPNPKYDFSWVKPGVAVWDWRINGAEWEGFKYTMSYPSWQKCASHCPCLGETST